MSDGNKSKITYEKGDDKGTYKIQVTNTEGNKVQISALVFSEKTFSRLRRAATSRSNESNGLRECRG